MLARCTVLTLCLAAASALSGQELLLAETFQPNRPTGLYLLAPDGSRASLVATLPVGWRPTYAAADEFNQGFFLCAANDLVPNGARLYRLTTAGLRTLHAGPPLLSPQGGVWTGTGAWFLVDQDLRRKSLRFFLFRPGGSFTTLGTVPGLAVLYLAMDWESGHPLLGVFDANRTAFAYLRADPRTGRLSTFAPVSPALLDPSRATHPAYDPLTGGHVVAAPDRTGRVGLFRLVSERGASRLSTLAPAGLPLGLVRRAERTVPQRTYALLLRLAQKGTTLFMEATATGQVRRTALLPRALPLPSRGFLVRRGSRPLAVFPGPGRRFLFRLRFPAEAGRPYLLGLSFMGSRPGVFLSPGRVLPLRPDFLTLFALLGPRTIFQNLAGRLGPAGEAAAAVDLNPFGQAVAGLRFTALALVLDPTAPGGVGDFSPPLVVTVP